VAFAFDSLPVRTSRWPRLSVRIRRGSLGSNTGERSKPSPTDATKKTRRTCRPLDQQLVLRRCFLFAGAQELAGAPKMVQLFAAIGWGQWFRYFHRTVELSAAVALLIPSAALFGAILLVMTMVVRR